MKTKVFFLPRKGPRKHWLTFLAIILNILQKFRDVNDGKFQLSTNVLAKGFKLLPCLGVQPISSESTYELCVS